MCRCANQRDHCGARTAFSAGADGNAEPGAAFAAVRGAMAFARVLSASRQPAMFLERPSSAPAHDPSARRASTLAPDDGEWRPIQPLCEASDVHFWGVKVLCGAPRATGAAEPPFATSRSGIADDDVRMAAPRASFQPPRATSSDDWPAIAGLGPAAFGCKQSPQPTDSPFSPGKKQLREFNHPLQDANLIFLSGKLPFLHDAGDRPSCLARWTPSNGPLLATPDPYVPTARCFAARLSQNACRGRC